MIVIEMQRRKAGDEIAELRLDRGDEALDQLARMAARWADDNQSAVAGADPDMHGLTNRVADNWRPLFAIAEVIGAEWPERIFAAARALAPRETESIGPMLLEDMRGNFDEKNTERLTSADAVESLVAMEGRPWAEWKAGKPLSANQLAKLLKPFGVRPQNIRSGGRVIKGYERHQFEDAWATYLAP